MKNSNDQTNTAKLSPMETALLGCMLASFAGGIGCIFFSQQLISVFCFLAHGCLALTYIIVSQYRLLDDCQREHARANEEAEKRSRLKENSEQLLVLQTENESCKRKLHTTEASLQEMIHEKETLKAQLIEATKSEDYDHLLPEAGETTVLNIIAVTQAVIDEMAPFCNRSGIQVQLASSSDQLLVKADAGYLRILFRNIIDNSVKYMKRSGSIVITLSLVGSDLFIVLKDNGVGLPTQETAHIFELNYQGSNRVSGNGLGLTQSKAIVEYYGGTIYAKSGKDSGMAIYIQLPAVEGTGGGL